MWRVRCNLCSVHWAKARGKACGEGETDAGLNSGSGDCVAKQQYGEHQRRRNGARNPAEAAPIDSLAIGNCKYEIPSPDFCKSRPWRSKTLAALQAVGTVAGGRLPWGPLDGARRVATLNHSPAPPMPNGCADPGPAVLFLSRSDSTGSFIPALSCRRLCRVPLWESRADPSVSRQALRA